MADKQQNRVYKSEQESGIKATPDFKTVAECQKYVNKVLNSKAVLDQFSSKELHKGAFTVTVTDGRGCRRATASTDGYGNLIINLPKWARSKFVILHELAHHLQKTYAINNWRESVNIGQTDPVTYQSHGARFIASLLFLVRRELGKDVHDSFATALWQNGCKTLDGGRVVSVSLPRKQAEKQSA
jgi:putative metallohydrolase (TIGR04338 family)